MSHWAQQWKMSFNPDPSKQAEDIIFSRKVDKGSHTSLTFSNIIVYQTTSQKHLGITLDNRLSFEEHLRLVLSKTSKTIGLLCKLHCLIARSALLTICKTLVRPHLDYGDIIYEKAYYSSFNQKRKSVQYNVITGAIRGTSKEKLHYKLGLESFQFCYWFRKLCYFYKFYNNESPHYLFKLVPLRHSSYITRNAEIPLFIQNKTIFSKIRFFPQLVPSRTVLTTTFEKSEALVFLKTIS